MESGIQPVFETPLNVIEPDARLVILARTMRAADPDAESALKDQAIDFARLGDRGLGQALYRYRSGFRSDAEAPVWSHLELRYFRDIVPADAIQHLVYGRQPAATELLRAEILLTTPASFILPADWQGSADRPEWQVSLEYIDVQSAHLGEYRNAMRQYFGPAAARLVSTSRIGTFRSMETVAVLHRAPGLKLDWNQIHLCDIDPRGFDGFGALFAEVLPDASRAGGLAGVFARLDEIRKVSHWTLNDAVAEAGQPWLDTIRNDRGWSG